MEATLFQLLWYVLIFVLIAGYFVLDGFDLGTGILYPFVAKTETEKGIVRRSIGPVWDGNEVWLLTAGGALFAAFAPAYATTFSGFYLAVMLVLFGLIVRAASIEFRHHDPQWGRLWDGCFFVGSLLPALLLGVAVGNIYAGIPMDANGDYAGLPLIGLISPFTLLCGLLGLSMFMASGATWVILKTPLDSQVRARAKKIAPLLHGAAFVLFAVVSAYALLVIKPEMNSALTPVRWMFALLTIGGIVFSAWKSKTDSDKAAFVAQSASCVTLVGLLASSLFPNLVVAAQGSVGQSITLMNAASSELSLMWMTIFACIGVPLVLVYHVIVYRTFRGRISEADVAEH